MVSPQSQAYQGQDEQAIVGDKGLWVEAKTKFKTEGDICVNRVRNRVFHYKRHEMQVKKKKNRRANEKPVM